MTASVHRSAKPPSSAEEAKSRAVFGVSGFERSRQHSGAKSDYGTRLVSRRASDLLQRDETVGQALTKLSVTRKLLWQASCCL